MNDIKLSEYRIAEKALVIGASTGGVAAIREIVSGLPKDYTLAVVIVIHSSSSSEGLLERVFQAYSELPVKEANEKEVLLEGRIYLMVPNYHLLVERDYTFSLSIDPKVEYSRPSIDVLFESMADVYEHKLTAVLLTGANHDGSQGLLAVRESGGTAIVQSPEDAEMSLMPLSAIELAGADHIEPLLDIVKRLALLQ